MDQDQIKFQEKPTLPSITSLLKEAFGIYNSNFWLFFTANLLPAVLAAVLSFLTESQKLILNTHQLRLTAAPGHNLILSLCLDAILVLGMIWGQVALLIICRDRKNHNNLLLSYKNALPKVTPFISASLLSSLAGALGLILFVIPGILAIIYLSQASFIAVAEGKSGINSLRESYNLTKGRWLQVAVRFFALLLLLALVSALGSASAGNFTRPQTALTAISFILDLVTTPFFLCYSFLLYEKLKV